MSDPPVKLHTPILETARLVLRPARYQDAPIIQRKFPRWEIVKHLHAKIPWPFPEDGAEAHLREHIPKVEAGESCGWMICLKDALDDPIGRIDLRPFDGVNRDMRGFWLAPEHWGKGLMTEAADRVVDFAFRDLGWKFLWVTNAAVNTRSAAVKQRQRAVLVETVEADFVSGRLPKQVWRIDAEDWLARHTEP